MSEMENNGFHSFLLYFLLFHWSVFPLSLSISLSFFLNVFLISDFFAIVYIFFMGFLYFSLVLSLLFAVFNCFFSFYSILSFFFLYTFLYLKILHWFFFFTFLISSFLNSLILFLSFFFSYLLHWVVFLFSKPASSQIYILTKTDNSLFTWKGNEDSLPPNIQRTKWQMKTSEFFILFF